MNKTRVLVVDDSAVIRKLVSDILNADEELEVVGTAADAFIAREKIKLLNPDVLTLDIEMPKMDGITFLKNLMRLRPMPVVMLSTLTSKGANHTLEALNIGAIDFVCKPTGTGQGLEDCGLELTEKVKNAAQANVKNRKVMASVSLSNGATLESRYPVEAMSDDIRLIALGASTGGTEAIREVLFRMPAYSPAMVITQHIPKEFSLPFANRMNSISAMDVKQAEDGDLIKPGCVYIAPGDQHLLVERIGPSKLRCRLNQEGLVNRHRPAVDVMFDSVVQELSNQSIGVLLTGMGKDGAQGLKRLRMAGSSTIAQDELSSVVWGMPGEAVKIGGADFVAPLDQIAENILRLVCAKSQHRTVAAS